MKNIILISFFIVFLSRNRSTNEISTDSNLNEFDRTRVQDKSSLELDFGFRITLGGEESYGDYKTYTSLKLKRENNTIFSDNSLIEYEFKNEKFPYVLKTGENKFEILFEINNRPNKNYLKRLFIQDNRVVGEDKLPILISKAIDINNDGTKELAGFWDYAQTCGQNNNLTAYNPILYYEITKTGFKLDSSMTKERNKKIYGEFHGLKFSEKFEQSSKVLENFNSELELIHGKK